MRVLVPGRAGTSCVTFQCVIFSMSLSFHENETYNVISIPSEDLRQKSKDHESPLLCKMLKPEVNYFRADFAVFQTEAVGPKV